MQREPNKKNCRARKWTKRTGIFAIVFFLGKGVVWLALAAAGAYYALN